MMGYLFFGNFCRVIFVFIDREVSWDPTAGSGLSIKKLIFKDVIHLQDVLHLTYNC
jgi:hypothetical protein